MGEPVERSPELVRLAYYLHRYARRGSGDRSAPPAEFGESWRETDRAAFLQCVREVGREPADAFAAILDEFIAWSSTTVGAVEFEPASGSQKVVKFVLRGTRTPFWTAYPGKTVPTKLAVIDSDSPLYPAALRARARNELATLDPEQEDDTVSPSISFEALRQLPDTVARVKDILTALLVAVSSPATQPSPPASDLEPPARTSVTTSRVVRDTQLAQRVKALHGYRCQVCGETIRLPDGGCYAEAHHLRPLGNPHDGPDAEGNVVCVCPNHHAELDLGLWDIDPARLRSAIGHKVGAEYVEYHNRVIRKRW